MLNFVIKKITFILKLPSALEPPHLSDDLTAKRMMLMALREGYSILSYVKSGNDSNLLIVFYVQIMPDDFVMQLHRF